MRRLFAPAAAFAAAGLVAVLLAAPTAPPAYNPGVAKASDEGQKALARFRLPAGVAGHLFAAEPLLANPVAFCLDEKGVAYVAETFRLHAGVTDNRSHMYWLDDDIACRTVEDRVAMYKKHHAAKFEKEYATEHDRVKRVVDKDGDGTADEANVFADGFNKPADGLASGVLAHKGDVYFTNIPDLWRLRDTKGTGTADVKESLATGFGVHVAFIGHDMHGLVIGPDGRLYFSIGDRGLNVKTKEGKHLYNPDSGAVMRCELDGSNLELFATGLRNPQELAFDQYGNLFTGDNNSDSGDQARLVHVVEGGDTGWRIGYQYGSGFHYGVPQQNRGPWNTEKLWHTAHEGQPAYIIPPVAQNICAGPSGFCYDPGVTALPEKYRDHFFLCDFRGGSGGSGVLSFAVKPKGASFEMTDRHEAFWSVLATDCAFGPDGGMYVSDWVDGWGKTGKGRLYRFAEADKLKSEAVQEVKKLLAEGFDKRPTEELVKLLGHADMRVRQGAQFALAAKGKDAVSLLAKVAETSKDRFVRLHAVWGLGQVGRKHEIEREVFERLVFHEKDGVVRAALADSMVDAGCEPHDLLGDEDPNVQLRAVLARARLYTKYPLPPEGKPRAAVFAETMSFVKGRAGNDPALRHAGVMMLSLFPADMLMRHVDNDSPTVRLAVVLALRRQASPKLADFLADADPKVVAEAARAINDLVIADALPALAGLLEKKPADVVAYRALNAAFRLGKPEHAAAIARFAARADVPEHVRVFAVKLLGEWAKPPRRDQVTGLTMDLPARDAAVAVEALRPQLGGVFAGGDALRKEAAAVAAKLGIKEVGPLLLALVGDAKSPAALRVEAVKALQGLKDARVNDAVATALASDEPLLRVAGRSVLAATSPDEAIKQVAGVLEKGPTVEKQGSIALLGELAVGNPAARSLLEGQVNALLDGKTPEELRLDVLEAAAKPFAGLVSRYEAKRDKADELAAWRESLAGGDAERGRAVFLAKDAVACLRCHKVDGQGGDVGPPMNGIGAKQKRDYLLESIVLPNKQIAKGFETVVLTLTSGKQVSGVLKAEAADSITLATPEGKTVVVPKKEVDERTAGPSAMPADLTKHLSRREMRDLVEFLASLKDEKK